MASFSSMPGCCTGSVLASLGEDGHGGREVLTQEQIRRHLDSRLKPQQGMRYASTQVVIATTNGRSQPRTEAALLEAGFECSTEVSSSSQAKVWTMTDLRWKRLSEERWKAEAEAKAAEAAERQRQQELEVQRARERAEQERLERARQQELPVEVANRQGPFRDAQGRFAARPAQPQLQNGDRFRLPGDRWIDTYTTPVHRYLNGRNVGLWDVDAYGDRLRPDQLAHTRGRITREQWEALPVLDLPRYRG